MPQQEAEYLFVVPLGRLTGEQLAWETEPGAMARLVGECRRFVHGQLGSRAKDAGAETDRGHVALTDAPGCS